MCVAYLVKSADIQNHSLHKTSSHTQALLYHTFASRQTCTNTVFTSKTKKHLQST
jgi:hypothetical protein